MKIRVIINSEDGAIWDSIPLSINDDGMFDLAELQKTRPDLVLSVGDCIRIMRDES